MNIAVLIMILLLLAVTNSSFSVDGIVQYR